MYLNRKLATEYLRQRGFKCGDSRLAHLAVTGDGPEFQYEGKYPIYTQGALDAWIQSRITAPVRSTAEAAALLNESEKQDSNPPPPTHTTQHRAAAPKRPGRPRQEESAQAELKTDAA